MNLLTFVIVTWLGIVALAVAIGGVSQHLGELQTEKERAEIDQGWREIAVKAWGPQRKNLAVIPRRHVGTHRRVRVT